VSVCGITEGVHGDPHFTTLDGTTYDYNGIGEYWLIKSAVLAVQVRLVQAVDANNVPVSGSVVAACAVQVPTVAQQSATARVHVQLMNSQCKCTVVRSIRAVSL
jgi:hypothetical protein